MCCFVCQARLPLIEVALKRGHHGCAQALWRAQHRGATEIHLWIPLRISAGSVSDARLWLECAEALSDIEKTEEDIMVLLAKEAPSMCGKEADDTWELAGVQQPELALLMLSHPDTACTLPGLRQARGMQTPAPSPLLAEGGLRCLLPHAWRRCIVAFMVVFALRGYGNTETRAAVKDGVPEAVPQLHTVCSAFVAGVAIANNRHWAALYDIEHCVAEGGDPGTCCDLLQKRESELQTSLAAAFEVAAPHWMELDLLDAFFSEGLQRLAEAVKAPSPN